MALTERDSLIVKVKADIRSLQAGLRQAAREADVAGKAMGQSFKAAAKDVDASGLKISDSMRAASATSAAALRTVAAATAAAAVASGLATKKALDYASSIKDTASAADLGVESLQAYRFAFEQSGVSSEKTDAALIRLNKTIGDAALNGGEAAEHFETLGIAVRGVDGDVRPTEAILHELSDALSKVGSAQEQASIAAKFFGREAGPRLVELLSGGSAALREYGENARSAGAIISADVIKRGADAADQLDALTTVIKADLTSALVDLSPILLAAAGGFRELASAAGAGISAVAGTIEDLAQAPSRIDKVTESIRRLFQFQGPAAGFAFLDALAPPPQIEIPQADERPQLRVGQLDEGPVGMSAMQRAQAERAREDEAKAASAFRDRELAETLKHNAAIVQQSREFIATESALEEMRYSMRKAALEKMSAAEYEAAAQDVGETRNRNDLLAALAVDHQARLAEIETAELERDAARFQRDQEYLAQRLTDLQVLEDATLSSYERDLLAEDEYYASLAGKLAAYSEEELAALGGYWQVKEKLWQEHQNRLTEIDRGSEENRRKIQRLSMSQATADIIGGFAQLTGQFATQSKKMFKLSQALALGEAIVRTYNAVNLQLSSGDPYTAYARAIAAGIYGLANVAAIASTKFGQQSAGRVAAPTGSGDGASSGGGGNVAAASARQTNVTINVPDGMVNSLEFGRWLVSAINQATADGAQLRNIKVI